MPEEISEQPLSPAEQKLARDVKELMRAQQQAQFEGRECSSPMAAIAILACELGEMIGFMTYDAGPAGMAAVMNTVEANLQYGIDRQSALIEQERNNKPN